MSLHQNTNKNDDNDKTKPNQTGGRGGKAKWRIQYFSHFHFGKSVKNEI